MSSIITPPAPPPPAPQPDSMNQNKKGKNHVGDAKVKGEINIKDLYS